MALLKGFQFFVLSVVLLVGLQSQAAERIFKNPSGEQLIAFQQNQMWFVKWIRFNVYRWPELIEQKQYKHWSQVENLVQQGQFVTDFSAGLETAQPIGWELREPSLLENSENTVLWKAENQWSWDWELKYAEWLQNDVDVEFFKKYNIKTDCADVQYYVRWIFARIYKLPMASRLPGGSYLTQNSVKAEWANLPTNEIWHKDKRFLAAMVYLTNLVYTHTLYRDSYPVELNATALLPGAFHLTISGKSGHTMVVYRQTPATSGVRIQVMSSTVPRAVRVLSSHRPMSYEYAAEKSAMLRMRWPLIASGKVSLVDAKKMPYYSTAQFDLKEPNINRILNPNPNWDVEYDDAVQLVTELLNQRKIAVQEGYKVCFPNKCDPAGADWDNHSTPSRDRRLREAMAYFDEELASEYSKYAERSSKEIIFEYEGEGYSLKNVRYIFEGSHASADPNLSLENRWPLGPQRFVKSITDRMQASLKNRRERIQKSNEVCKVAKQCAVGTDLFKKLFLDDVVLEILTYQDFLSSYATFYPDQNDLFNSAKKLKFSDGISEKSLEEWSRFVRFASVDPRSKPEHKEGDYSELFNRIQLGENQSIQHSTKSGLVFINATVGYKIYQIEQQRRLVPVYIVNSDEKIRFYNTKTEEVLVCVSNGCAFYNYNTKEKKFEVPVEFVGDDISLTYRGNTLIASESAAENDNYYTKNLKVYDIKKKKVIFSVDQSQKIGSYSVAKDLKYVSYIQYSADFKSSQSYLVDLQKEDQTPVALKFMIYLNEYEDYFFSSHYLFGRSSDQMALYDLNDEKKVVYYGTIKQAGRAGIVSKTTEDNQTKYFYVAFDEKAMRFNETEISELTKYKFTWSLYGEESAVYFFSANSNNVLEIFATNDKVDYRVSSKSEIKLKSVGPYTTYAKFVDNQNVRYQLRHDTQGAVTTWMQSPVHLIEAYGHPGTYFFKTYDTEWHYYIYSITQPQTSLLNLFFETTQTGLFFNTGEIWLLK